MINKLIASVVACLPERFVWLFSKRYIAGKNIEDAVRTAKNLNKSGISVTVDVLGEYIHKKSEAESYKNQYLNTINQISENKLNATISVKPTMFGLLLDTEFCYEQLRELITYAGNAGIKVCMDMEDASCTDSELSLFERLHAEFPGKLSIVLQAYLKRSMNDLIRLSKINSPEYPIDVRICKGIYVEPASIAYKSKSDINNNYIECLDYMIKNNFYSSIATHDSDLISRALIILQDSKLSTGKYEFQMLYGVRSDLRDKLVREGHKLRLYVPYGEHWFGYSTRRLKENPRMVSHIIKALFTNS